MKAIEVTEKECKSCGIVKSTREFYIGKQRGNSDQVWLYYDSLCKQCRIQYSIDRRRTIKKRAVEYLGGKCAFCGLTDNCASIYVFHHQDSMNKDYDIGAKVLCLETMRPELDKCILLCSNCHIKLHAKERA